jgi:hypothetical protein
MRLSERRVQRVYGAISDPIIQLRIAVSRADAENRPMSPKELDERLFALEIAAWKGVRAALNLEAR